MVLQFSNPDKDGVSTLTRPALVFLEGQHTDSGKRTHFFSKDRVQKIVANTNEFFRQGRRIPLQLDHKKNQDSNIGDVNSEFYTKEITREDLPDTRHTHLLGKLGVFVDEVLIKGADAVQKVIDKKIKTLSPGIDPATESFIEVSATPIPAIIGPSLFSKTGEEEDNVIYFESSLMSQDEEKVTKEKAFSFKDLERIEANMSKIQKDYNEISNKLFRILYDLKSSSEEELKGTNPYEASYDAIEYFIDKVTTLFNIKEGQEKEETSKEAKAPLDSSKKFPVGVQPSDFKKNTKSIGFRIK